MPMEETNIPCPVCHYFLTDVDGLLECQNPEAKVWHVNFFSSDPNDPYFKDNAFNFEAYFDRPEERLSNERAELREKLRTVDTRVSSV